MLKWLIICCFLVISPDVFTEETNEQYAKIIRVIDGDTCEVQLVGHQDISIVRLSYIDDWKLSYIFIALLRKNRFRQV